MMQLMDGFEKLLKSDYIGYIGENWQRLHKTGAIVDDYGKDWFYSTPKANGLFRVYLSGYMAGRCEYMERP